MYEKLLVPVDGSDGAREILRHASDIAGWTGATVQLLFVADTTRDSVTAVQGEVVDALAQEGEDVVREAAEVLEANGVAYDTDVEQGDPAPTIVEYAEQYGHDLVVMPTHGREGLSRYLLGSVTEKVVRLSSVPVLTARMQPDEELSFPYEDVLVPTDGSGAATHAADHGLALADALDATVHALSVVEEGGLGVDDERDDAAREAIDDLVAAAEDRGVAVARHVARGSPAEEIVGYVEGNDVDAVVMGTSGRRGVDQVLLGSVAEKTVRSAPVPVVTVADE